MTESATGVASLSIDVDDQWAYLRAAGQPDWDDAATILPLAIDRAVQLCGELGLPLTTFLIGRDLTDDRRCDAILKFGRLSAWEPANHSLHHLPWMHTMSAAEIADEIELTEDRIVAVTRHRPLGFRGPGFSCPDEVLRVLARRGYAYDASIFPTSMAPIARAVFLAKSDLRGEERERAKRLYGGFAAMRRPNRPHRRDVPDAISDTTPNAVRTLWEIPVTVMPFTRTPIHFSYFTFLASQSVASAKVYFRSAIRLCQLTRTPPSLLLHPPDFLGRDDATKLASLPGMNMTATDKLALVRWALRLLADRFRVTTLIDQVGELDPRVIEASLSRPDPGRSGSPDAGQSGSPDPGQSGKLVGER